MRSLSTDSPGALFDLTGRITLDPITAAIMIGATAYFARLVYNGGYLTKSSQFLAIYRQRSQQIRQQRQQRASQQAREFQAAILAIDSNPDFLRVAAAVRAADLVPTAFKQRQYHRFRPHFIRHYRRCLQRGTNPQQLRNSVEQLVMSFEFEPFEADYFRTEAEHLMTTSEVNRGANTVDDFQTRIQQAHDEHRRRTTAIEGLTGISDEIRQQLLEVEERRYQSALFGDDAPGA